MARTHKRALMMRVLRFQCAFGTSLDSPDYSKWRLPGRNCLTLFFFLNKKSFGEFRSIDLYVSLGAQSRGMQNPLLAGRSLSSSGQLRKSEGRKRKKKDVVGRGLYGISFRTDPHAQNNKGIENNLCNNSSSSSSESKKNRKKKLLKESRKVRSRPFPSSRDTQAKKKKKKKKNKQRSRKTVGRQIGRVPRERQHTQRRRNNRSRGKLGRILFNWRFIGRGQLDYFSVPPLFLSRCRKKRKKGKMDAKTTTNKEFSCWKRHNWNVTGANLRWSHLSSSSSRPSQLSLSLSRSTRARLPQLARPDINKQTNDEKLCLSFVVLDSNSRG